jgi:NAD(P)-dependent dehydrogenase (short-subunit alcohol dehydrogenase family)
MAFTLDNFSLKGKVALVTGAGGRGNSIGRAYAFGLANAGAAVVVADINGDGARTVAAELIESGAKALGLEIDITDPASVARGADDALQAFGGVDILVNNAALMAELDYAPPSKVSLADWNRIFEVNVTGALNCVQALVPNMRARGGGRIINAISAGAYPAFSVYGISKLALAGLTTALARELGPDGICVNGIAPGCTGSDAGMSLTPPGSPRREQMARNVVMRLDGAPDELAGTLLLLASPAGAWITGQIIHVDGGWVIRP